MTTATVSSTASNGPRNELAPKYRTELLPP
jgi:hypothetical protein